MSENHSLQDQYQAFKKLILNDNPYEICIDDNEFFPIFTTVFNEICKQHSLINDRFYSKEGKGIIDFTFIDQYLIFCYRIANYIYKKSNDRILADAIYYSSRIRCNTDLYYTAEIGDFFIPVHTLGTVMDSRSTYGKLFQIYNGVHIGPYKIIGIAPEDWKHPKFGDGVTLLGNCSIYGDTEIGDNVTVSAGAVIINEKIPSNCIVIGQSPKLYVLPNNLNNMDFFLKKT